MQHLPTGRKIGTLASLTLIIGFGVSTADAQKMYWTEFQTGRIQRANLDGSNVEELVAGLGSAHGIALDTVGGKMYWPDTDSRRIQRANLDGSGVEDLITTGIRAPIDIALDLGAGKMYWVDGGVNGAPKIQRANLNGSGREDLVTSADGLVIPWGIALDVDAGKMYWVDGGVFGALKIQRANLNGSGIEDLVTSADGLVIPWGIALDVDAGKMYWTDGVGAFTPDRIRRANLDGSNIEDLVTSGLEGPEGIALDLAAGKMYWVDTSSCRIQRANLNGSQVEDLGLACGAMIALYPAAGKMYWTDPAAFAPERIWRADLDGSDVEEVLVFDPASAGPFGIALDLRITAPDLLHADPTGIENNRYLSFWAPPSATAGATEEAIRITLDSVAGFGGFNGEVRWVGPPGEFADEGLGTFIAAPLQCEPHFMDWTGFNLINVFGAEIVPDSSNTAQRADIGCPSLNDESCYSEPLVITTAKWGDVAAPFGGNGQPDFTDIAGLVDKFQSLASGPPKARAQLQPNVVRPDSPIDFSDIAADIDAFTGQPYPFTGPSECP